MRRFPPDGANRGHYRNPPKDALSDQIRVEINLEKRKALSSEAPKNPCRGSPYLPLWLNDVVSVHQRRLGPCDPSSRGEQLLARNIATQLGGNPATR